MTPNTADNILSYRTAELDRKVRAAYAQDVACFNPLGAPPARRGSAKERMAELQDLLSAELISQAEFNAKRQAILASI